MKLCEKQINAYDAQKKHTLWHLTFVVVNWNYTEMI